MTVSVFVANATLIQPPGAPHDFAARSTWFTGPVRVAITEARVSGARFTHHAWGRPCRQANRAPLWRFDSGPK